MCSRRGSAATATPAAVSSAAADALADAALDATATAAAVRLILLIKVLLLNFLMYKNSKETIKFRKIDAAAVTASAAVAAAVSKARKYPDIDI